MLNIATTGEINIRTIKAVQSEITYLSGCQCGLKLI